MARQLFVALFATILLYSISSAIAIRLVPNTDSPATPATTFIQKTCNDTTYTTLCLNTLLPNANRINGSSKKAARLAIAAVPPEIQTTSDNILDLSQQPQLWSREVDALNQCNEAITNTFSSVINALQLTNKLGGGSKGLKEARRLSIQNDLQSVVRATDSCTSSLQGAGARSDVVSQANEATQLLVQLTTNAVNLVHHMVF